MRFLLPAILAVFSTLGCSETLYCQSGAKYGTQCYSGAEFRGNAADMTDQEVEEAVDHENARLGLLSGVSSALQVTQKRNTSATPPRVPATQSEFTYSKCESPF